MMHASAGVELRFGTLVRTSVRLLVSVMIELSQVFGFVHVVLRFVLRQAQPIFGAHCRRGSAVVSTRSQGSL